MLAIIGAGALGSLFAARLSARQRICFVSSRAPHAPEIRFELCSPFESPESQPVNAHHAFELIAPDRISKLSAPLDSVLICTKSHAAPLAVDEVCHWLPKDIPIVLFQNGLGSQFQILENHPDRPFYAAVTTEGANRNSKGQIIHAGRGQTRLGRLAYPDTEYQGQPDTALTEKLVTDLQNDSLDIVADDHIWQALWIKLAINCAINPFTAILDCPNGEILNSDLFRQHWPALKMELTAMLQAAGYPCPVDALENKVAHVARATAQNISSMLQDVRSGRKTEIDDINGFARRFLSEHNLPCETNTLLWEQVHALGN